MEAATKRLIFTRLGVESECRTVSQEQLEMLLHGLKEKYSLTSFIWDQDDNPIKIDITEENTSMDIWTRLKNNGICKMSKRRDRFH